MWNRSPAKCDALAAAGAQVGERRESGSQGAGGMRCGSAGATCRGVKTPKDGWCTARSQAPSASTCAAAPLCSLPLPLPTPAGCRHPRRGGCLLRHHPGHAVRPGGMPGRGHRWVGGWGRGRASGREGAQRCTCRGARWHGRGRLHGAVEGWHTYSGPGHGGAAQGCEPDAALHTACSSEGRPRAASPPHSLPCAPPAAPDGAAAAMAPGKGYVDVSTVDAATAAAVAAAVRSAGGAYLEAPVSGSKGPAEQGQLIFLSAGGWAGGWVGTGAGRRWVGGCGCLRVGGKLLLRRAGPGARAAPTHPALTVPACLRHVASTPPHRCRRQAAV